MNRRTALAMMLSYQRELEILGTVRPDALFPHLAFMADIERRVAELRSCLADDADGPRPLSPDSAPSIICGPVTAEIT